MPIIVGSNIASLRAQRQLDTSSKGLASTFERLSSGLRINKASDDAAGLSIASQLNSSKRVFTQGIRNFNDGLSLLSIADSAIEQLSGIVSRLQELATQSSNGILGNKQRSALDAEAQALSKEYTRIIQSTKFNGLSILSANMGSLRLQGGYGTDGSIASDLGGEVGTGTFTLAQSLGLSDVYGNALATGDINGDGILDVVTSGQFQIGPVTYQSSINIFIGKGDGTFNDPVLSTDVTYSNFSDIRLVDLNNDGKLDIAAAGSTNLGVGKTVTMLGRGDGTFGASASYQSSQFGGDGLTFGDMNQDGVLDLLTAVTYNLQDYFTINYGKGDGSFGSATTYETDAGGRILAVDVNNDGILDAVSAGINYSMSVPAVSIRLGNGDGTFKAATSFAAQDALLFGFVSGDFNGDGNLDFVSSGLDSGGRGAIVMLGNGDGTFRDGGDYALTEFNTALCVGDVNGDGFLDIASAGLDFSYASYNSVLFGNGDGTFRSGEPTATNGVFGTSAALADLNGDGVLDFVLVGTDQISGAGAVALEVRLNQTSAGVSTLLDFTLKTQADSLQAIPIFQRKLSQLAEQRGTIGAFQARLTVGVNSLSVAAENYAAAESRITDVDVAQESSALVRLKILQDAASSILAQANQQPALAVKLLSGNSS